MRDGVASFKGVRYGATTEGRRLPPQLPQRWEGVRDALDYGNQAPQLSGLTGMGSGAMPSIAKGMMPLDQPNSEDCLFLNV